MTPRTTDLLIAVSLFVLGAVLSVLSITVAHGQGFTTDSIAVQRTPRERTMVDFHSTPPPDPAAVADELWAMCVGRARQHWGEAPDREYLLRVRDAFALEMRGKKWVLHVENSRKVRTRWPDEPRGTVECGRVDE
jgi:hypothetical protein